jgi:hypothetical protein
MKSIRHIGNHSVSMPLAADNIVEFHAARILLLIKLCGTAGSIDGLTKLAKLDFFVRYPDFFDTARAVSAPDSKPVLDASVESAMVRHHYGPWDKRYYHVLAYLEARQLIQVAQDGKTFRISLTPQGTQAAADLSSRVSFASLVRRMQEVKKVFGAKSGTTLKNLIYKMFDAEVAKRPLGQMIGS